MAFKKGFCTHCKGDEKARIFNVNKEAEVCHCPHCAHTLKPKEAISNYRWLISSHLKKASKALFESTEYLLAYQTFAHVIDLDDTVKVAYFGRLLSLVYLSTLRTSKIPFALQMHRQQAKLFHYQETAREYFNFLWLLLDALDKYENRMTKRIKYHSFFYDEDCISLYLKRVDEIRKYKEFITLEAEFFIEANKEQYNVVVERVKNGTKEYKGIFNQRFVTTEGKSYLFDGFGKDDMPIVNLQKHLPAQPAHNYKPLALLPNEEKKPLINDDIYQSNLTLSRLIKVSIPVAIILLAVVASALIISFIVEPKAAKLVIYIVSVLLLAASFLLILLHFAWKNSLKKKYYNGTNPFIFK